ncbi:MAG TPA: glycosyltransferase family 2 protein [Candidatus Nitrosocosmicus sp.]|nr:glycosyltransferase family 2 protein [Candidatus Nitrosocosmicus sp.]
MLSAVILTKDEERNIERCLRSLNFVDEIIIVDDNSTDKTIEIAKKYSAHVHTRSLDNNFADQRNFGMEKANGELILFVDADEEVTVELKDEIISELQDPSVIYWIKRRDFFWGNELRFGEIKKIRNEGLIRLVTKNSGEWVGNVHEEYIGNDCGVQLKNYINHYPHQTIAEFIHHINNYSSIRAKELHEKKVKSSLFQIIFYPLGKFIVNYFFKLGFKDRAAGFVYAFMMSFHSFLVRTKLYQLQDN